MRNSLEEKFHAELLKKKKRKTKVAYEQDRLKYIVEHTYIPDFTVTFPDGRNMFIEVKGYLRPEDRVKMVAVKRNNPDADIRIVFAQDNKLGKKLKTRYSTWAEKRGFPCAIGHIPEEWLK